MAEPAQAGPEWPTLGLLAACYGVWALATLWLAGLSLPLAVPVTALALVLHSSLCHEVMHDHPFADQRLNEALVAPALGLLVPYARFRDTHLAHHRDALLTDPYDDPESNYMDPAVWQRLPRLARALLMFNNTLLGRLMIGPLLGQVAFLRRDGRAIRAGAPGVLRGWLWHLPAALPVVLWVGATPMPLWAYLLACYGALSVLKIRTFLEHRAHDRASGRTVVIEDRGPLALLFLNNNYHVVHHINPKAPWYRLPGLFARRRAHYLARNDGYRYASYAEVFRRHFCRAKDPVPHPLWPSR